MITAKLLLWSAIALLAFGALAFLAIIAVVIRNWLADRAQSRRFAVSPVSKLGGEK